MEIAYIVPSLANKGPIIIVKQLASLFIQNGHNCTVYFFDDKNELTFDCPVRKITTNERIEFHKYDVVHSHGIRPDRYIFKHKSKEKSKTLFVSTLHNYIFVDLRYEYSTIVAALFGRLWLRYLRKHDILIASCKDSLAYYSKWFPIQKLTYAYNTRNPDYSRKLEEKDIQILRTFKGESYLIGVNSLLTERKGIDLIINALPHLSGYKLLIVGDGKSRNSLERLTKKLNLESRCLFVGYQPDAYRYLPHYDIFALPSRSEGFPLALLEAAAFSIPTVASNIPVIKEAFSPDEVSFFDLKNPSSIIEAIVNATSNLTMARKMNQKFLTTYSPDLQYIQYLNIYKNKF